MNEIEQAKMLMKRVALVLAGLVVGWGSWFSVGPGEVGVTFNRLTGSSKSHSQGLHLKLPLFVGVTTFDVKTQRVDTETEAASKDIQRVNAHVVLNYHLKHEAVNTIYTTVGRDYVEKVIDPAVKEAVKAATAKFPAESIIVNRAGLKEQIEADLERRLAHYNIVQESLNLVDIKFSDDFNEVVEQKQIEEQKIKTAEYVRRQAEENKQKTILDAQAEAEKQRLMKANVTEDIIAMEWIKKWNGILPVTMLGKEGGVLLNMTEGR